MRYKLIKKLKNMPENLCAEFENESDAQLFLAIVPDSDKANYQIAESSLSVPSPFNVVAKNQRELVLAKFVTLTDAQDFIRTKLQDDAAQNQDITYYLLDGDEFVEKADQSQASLNQPRNRIRPKPPSLTLRPPGSAYGIYNKDEDE